jgi:hypothetical protein
MRKYSGYIFIIIIFLLLLLLLYCYCCHRGRKEQETVKHWISWNILFTPSSLPTSPSVKDAFETYLNNYVHSYDPSATLTFQYVYCPCDSLLTNIDATLVYGSGNSIPPPPTKPNPGPNGDYTLAENLDMIVPDIKGENFIDTANLIPDNVQLTTVPARKTLAVIDTGLDTLLFHMAYPNAVWAGDLLWQEVGRPTIFNVVLGESTGKLMDNNFVKHGTAATGITLSQIGHNAPGMTPRIMSIRAFDSAERGSIYTVSCALSCAIQQRADFINASWGYFGEEDTVLKKYLFQANDSGIRIIAAAGNTPGNHFANSVCNTTKNDLNDLGRLKMHDSLFYPACFAPIIPNLVSVTQLNKVNSNEHPFIPCFYQNYSSDYITVGAVETAATFENCCSFKVPFLGRPIEGSSFATPVITGILMSSALNRNDPIKLFIRTHKDGQTPEPFTDQGDYFFYNQSR